MTVSYRTRSYHALKKSAVIGQVRNMKFGTKVATAVIAVVLMFGGLAHVLADHTTGTYKAANQLGQADFTSGLANGQGIPNNEGFGSNRKIALDPVHHRLFTAEYGNSRVLIYNLDAHNQPLDQVADFVLGQPNFNSNKAAATPNGMQAPAGVTYDAKHDRLFVGDQGNARVLVFDLSGGVTNGMNASYVLGQPDFYTKTVTTGPQGLNNPMGLAYDSVNERLFASSYSGGRVMIWDFPGGVITSSVNANYALGTSDINAGPAGTFPKQNRLYQPAGLALDVATDGGGNVTRNRLFVAQYGAGRVTMFDLLGGVTTGMPASLVLGKPDFNGGTHATLYPIDTGDNDLLRPVDVNYDQANSRLFVGEYSSGGDPSHNRVMVYDFSGTPTNGMPASYVLGKSSFSDTSDGPTQDRMGAVWGTVYDPTSQQLLVSDIGNYRILAFDLGGGISNGMPAARVLGQTTNEGNPTFTRGVQNNVHIRDSAFNGPTALAIDPARHLLFVGDSYNRRILVYELDNANAIASKQAIYVLGQPDFTTNQQWPTGPNTFNSIGALQYDGAHNRLFVTDNYLHRVLAFDLSGGIQNNMNASHVIGQPDFTTATAGALAHGLNVPLGLALNENTEELFVADQGNNRILVFNLKNGLVNGMAAGNVIGQPDFSSIAAGTTAASVNRPLGLMFDSSEKRLFAADYANCRVLMYDLSGGVSSGMPAANVIGQADFTATPNCVSTKNTFSNQVSDVAYDASRQSLFVSDASSNRIVKFKLDKGITNGMDAAAVLGQADFTSTEANAHHGIPSADNFSYPRAMVHDDLYRGLFVADFYNNRVLQIDFIRMIEAPVSQLQIGEQYDATLAVQAQGNTRYFLTDGSLPEGIALDEHTGELSGAPQASGLYTFTVEGDDDNGTSGIFKDHRQYSLDIKPADTKAPIVTHGAADEPGGIHGNPASHTSTDPHSLVPDGHAHGTCQVIINLDEQPDFQNGKGYQVDTNNCYMLHFSASDENGETKKYSVIIDTVGDRSVDLSVAPHDAVHDPIAHLRLASGGTQRVQPSPSATTSLQVEAVGINRPTATLKFARAAKFQPKTIHKHHWFCCWLLLLILLLTVLFIFFLLWKRRKKEEEGEDKSPDKPYSKN